MTCCPWVLHENHVLLLSVIASLRWASLFEFFDKMSDRQAQMDKRLKDIESKLNSLSEGVADCNEDEEMSSQDNQQYCCSC